MAYLSGFSLVCADIFRFVLYVHFLFSGVQFDGLCLLNFERSSVCGCEMFSDLQVLLTLITVLFVSLT